MDLLCTGFFTIHQTPFGSVTQMFCITVSVFPHTICFIYSCGIPKQVKVSKSIRITLTPIILLKSNHIIAKS